MAYLTILVDFIDMIKDKFKSKKMIIKKYTMSFSDPTAKQIF